MSLLRPSPARPAAIRTIRLSLTVCLAVVIAAVLASPAGAGSRAPARLLVYAQEWSLWPSRTTVPAGRVDVELWNRGQDPHDLRIRKLRHGHVTGRIQGVAITDSGAVASAGWHLAPGTYELYCSLAGHLHKGMHTRLVVR